MSTVTIRRYTEQSNVRHSRPTIALLSENLGYEIPHFFLRSALAVTKAADVNLFYFSCASLRSSYLFNRQANILYDFVNAQNVNGILIASNIVGSFISHEEFQAFFRRYLPLPMVSMGVVLDDVPSLVLDNFTGMYSAVTHLIEQHGYRRIAFLGGPKGNADAQERYRAYTTALQDHGLAIDPRLVRDGPFVIESGFQAVQWWFDDQQYRPRQDIEAVVAANDYMAMGVLLELQRRGMRVPDDIAVTGFDNVAMGKGFTPPLTTVRQPFDEIGRQATEFLLTRLAGQPIPELTRIPAKLVTRQSCGCPASEVTSQRVVEEIHHIDQSSLLYQLNHGIYFSNSDLAEWDESLILLLNEQFWTTPDTQQFLNAQLGRQISRTIQESVLRSLQEKQRALLLQGLGDRMVSTVNLSEILDALVEDLPRLGIHSGYLALYEEAPPYQFPQSMPTWSRLVLAFDEQGRRILPPEGLRFATQDLLPPEVLRPEHSRQMVVEALYFQREQIGFAILSVETPDARMPYTILRRYLSSSLQGVLLVQRVQEHSAEIARQKYILDTFMENVPDSIYFKDRDSRILHVNQSLATRFGFQHPAEAIGKTDFDLFPAEEARPKYEAEQKIIRTGQPMLALEEPDAGGCWSLTTKMPLRDEHNEIIGTFGISRDITELKKAQQALVQANSEIRLLNVQLQEENVRMSAELNVVKQLQQMILPRPEELQSIPGLAIAGYMQPADEVGGDYYDVLYDNRLLHIGIGDVTGHGLESGVLMLMTQSAIRTLIEHGETDPVKFVNTLNRLIYKNAQRIGTDKNLTFALVQYQQGQFKLVGQHEELLVVRQNGQVERVNTMDLGFQVGLVDEISEWVHAVTIVLHPGDGIVLYTDGITEAENCLKKQYGVERLCDVVSQNWTKPVDAVKQAVIDDVFAHIGGHTMYDDITLVVLKQQ